MKLTKKQLKTLIQEEMTKELKGHLLTESEAQRKGVLLGRELYDSYDEMGTDDELAQEVYGQLKAMADAGQWDGIVAAKQSFNAKASKEGEEGVVAQTRDENPNDVAEGLISLFNRAENKLETMRDIDAREKEGGYGKYSKEEVAKKAMEQAKGYLEQFNLTPQILQAASALSGKLGPEKLAQGLMAVMQNLTK